MAENINKLTIRKAAEVVDFPDLEHHAGSIGFVEKMIIGQLLIIVQPTLVVETGTFRGCTAKFLCEFMKRNGLQECCIAAFDLPQVIEEIHRGDSYFAAQKNVQLVGGVLPDSLKRYLARSSRMVDLAIVDGDHSYGGVLADLETLAPYMVPGSYIFAHDYRKQDPKYRAVAAAVDHFAAMHRFSILPLNATDSGGIWGSALLRKPAEDELSLSP